MPTRDDIEPAPQVVPFEEGDFHALSEGLARDPQYNDRRLAARRKLAAVGEHAVAAIRAAHGLELLSRTSLHQPNTFNHMRVRRLWVYLCRAAAEKKRLKLSIGPELAKDLDAAYRNAYLCAALEADAIEVSLRIHVDAWYDGQNAAHRTRREGARPWLAELNRLDGYFLRLDDWKGEWRCGALTVERVEEFLRFYKPGEHSLKVERRFPAPPGARGAALGTDTPGHLVAEIVRLVPLYRWMAWSKESDFLFSR